MELMTQLKEYMNAMGRIVFENSGVVDKFIGDAVMGVWGLLQADREDDDARSAVAAAVAMQRSLIDLNAKWAEEGREPFRIGIGLNHGDVIFGMMGSGKRGNDGDRRYREPSRADRESDKKIRSEDHHRS